MSQDVYISVSSHVLPVEQLLQLAVQQLHSKMVQKYLDTLHPTLDVGHTSRGQLTYHQVAFHLSDTDLKAPDVMEHELQLKLFL